MTTDSAGKGPVERHFRPRAWQWLDSGILRKTLPATAEAGAWTPLYKANEIPFTQNDAGVLLRAADMLTAYAELIRRDGATHVEEHHYLPDVEYIATELRTLGIHGA